MKFTPPKLALSFWPTVGVGCVLALAPVAAYAQSVDPAVYTASQSQATDPIESKTGELNQAEPGGPVKITAQEALDVMMFGGGNVGEIRLGELALKNSENPEVKAFRPDDDRLPLQSQRRVAGGGQRSQHRLSARPRRLPPTRRASRCSP